MAGIDLRKTMITTDQILIHGVGDYITQSDWMAQNKTKAHWPAFCHALVYSLGFLVFAPSWKAWAVIFGTHFLIDRYRLARYVVWAKNSLAPKTWWKRVADLWSPMPKQDAMIWRQMKLHQLPDEELEPIQSLVYARTLPFSVCAGTGYPPSTPVWLSVWLLIIADNILHVAINGAALRYL